MPRSLLISLLLACSAILPGCRQAKSDMPMRPNVIVIVMDTVSGERCSVNGYARPTTVNLEKLAREGINFRNAWSPAGWTGPAHASLFTGLRPENHGFRRSNRSYLRDDAVTLAGVFQRAGYRTACFTNNPLISPEHGLTRGFDLVVPLHAFEGIAYPPAIATHAMALQWARESAEKKKPFFLVINDMEAHFPYTPPPEFAERFAGNVGRPEDLEAVDRLVHGDLFKHNIGLIPIEPAALQILSDRYDGEVACLDREVGRLVESLRKIGLLENSLVVVTSDHGENLGRHGILEHMASLHRTVGHVPLILRLPGAMRAGEVRPEVARLEDLFPTILEVCGLPVPGKIDGESLLGEMGHRRARAMVDSSESFLREMEREIGGRPGFERLESDLTGEFDGRLHRIRYSDGREILFDVIEDPEELHPLR